MNRVLIDCLFESGTSTHMGRDVHCRHRRSCLPSTNLKQPLDPTAVSKLVSPISLKGTLFDTVKAVEPRGKDP